MKSEELTVKDVARTRGVSLKWVYDLLAVGRLKGARKVGREWRIPAHSVQQVGESGLVERAVSRAR